jgi:hypothetical protein
LVDIIVLGTIANCCVRVQVSPYLIFSKEN